MKIAFRFFIINYSNINHVKTLSFFQVMFNNSANVIIDLSLNEIIYDFKIRDAFIEIVNSEVSVNLNFVALRLKYKKKAVDVIAFVSVKIKIYHNARHTSLLLNVEDYAYLRLHHKYHLFNRSNKKLFQQRCESFLVKKRVKRFAYELDLSFN